MLDIKLIFDIKDIDQLGNLPQKKKKKHTCMLHKKFETLAHSETS